MSEPVDDDERLLAELGEAVRVYEGAPDDVIAAAKDLFTWRTVDAELASLTFDSLLDDEPAAVRSTAVEPRVLTFEADGLAVEVEVDTDPERRLVGQLVPAQPAELELITPQRRVRATADRLGRFVVPLPAEPSRVTLRVVAGGGRVVTATAVI
jgi:hypothetical protein